jgi:hypothetical protein
MRGLETRTERVYHEVNGSPMTSVIGGRQINYINHEETLMKRYEENKDLVVSEVSRLLKDCRLKGQWSIDIMQNGSDFWLIDMARALESALSECVPKEKLKQAPLPFMIEDGLLEVGEL